MLTLLLFYFLLNLVLTTFFFLWEGGRLSPAPPTLRHCWEDWIQTTRVEGMYDFHSRRWGKQIIFFVCVTHWYSYSNKIHIMLKLVKTSFRDYTFATIDTMPVPPKLWIIKMKVDFWANADLTDWQRLFLVTMNWRKFCTIGFFFLTVHLLNSFVR